MKTVQAKNRVCHHRHAAAFDNPLRKLLQSPKRIVGSYIEEGDTVIDIGCGPGYFTLSMAEMVGPGGKVIGVDLQQTMLDNVQRKLEKSHLGQRITLHRCQEHSLDMGKGDQADFILAFYVVHEVPDQRILFEELKKLLKKGGTLLVVEPPFHVNRKAFLKSLRLAEQAGFTVLERPRWKGGMSMLLTH